MVADGVALSSVEMACQSNQFLINTPLLSVTEVLPFRPCRLFLCVTFIVFDFVISTFYFSLSFVFHIWV